MSEKSHLHVLVPNYHASIVSLERHSLASVRMRSALAARAAERMGWQVTLGERFDGVPNLLYVGKIGGHQVESRGPVWLQYIRKVRGRGCEIIVDYTDHYCGFDGVMTGFYRSLMPLTDHLITPSAAMTELVAECWDGVPIQISDPCEIDSRPWRDPGSSPWRALWFGSCTNVRYLIEFLTDERHRAQLSQVNIVTDASGFANLLQWARSLGDGFSMPRLELHKWSLQNLINAADLSDIAIIPSDPRDPRKAGVSENRLVTSLQLGLTTVATAMPAYQRFTESFINLDSDWSAKVREIMSGCPDRIAIQFRLADEFNKARLTKLWMATLASRRIAKTPGAEKLNRRCSHV